MTRIVLGVGLASAATAAEVASLADRVTREAGFSLDAVSAVATRTRFAGDPRLRLGPEIVGVEDDELLERFPTPADSTRPGLPARVAEGCALIVAGGAAELVAPPAPSAHATAALAVVREEPS